MDRAHAQAVWDKLESREQQFISLEAVMAVLKAYSQVGVSPTEINWKDAPEWANWVAQDSCGDWYWYADAPEYTSKNTAWSYEHNLNKFYKDAGSNPHWRNTLQERPR